MKKLSIIILLLLFLISPNITLAKTEAGTTPDSFFYFFDTTFEKVGLFFTFNNEKKVEKSLEYAQERLAEVEEMVKKEKTEDIEKLMSKYQENISFATNEIKNFEDEIKVEELFATISETILENEESLNTTLENVPEEIKTKIFQIIEDVKKENEEVKKQIQELKQEVENLKKQVEELQKDTEPKKEILTDQTKEIEELKKQAQELRTESERVGEEKQVEIKTEQKETTEEQVSSSSIIITLPNGAIVEMDTSGNIVRYIKEIPSNNSGSNFPSTETSSNVVTINSPQIININIAPEIDSATIEWSTNIPTKATVFLTDMNGKTVVYSSLAGLSTHHIVNIPSLSENIEFSYEIEVISNNISVKKTGIFKTLSRIPSSIEIINNPLNSPSLAYIYGGNCVTITFQIAVKDQRGDYMKDVLVNFLNKQDESIQTDTTSSPVSAHEINKTTTRFIYTPQATSTMETFVFFVGDINTSNVLSTEIKLPISKSRYERMVEIGGDIEGHFKTVSDNIKQDIISGRLINIKTGMCL